MDAGALQTFVTRSQSLLEGDNDSDSDPPADRRETRTWLVNPLLETLGWDTDADCDHTIEIDGTTVTVCSLQSIPVLLVAIQPASQSLTVSAEDDLLEAMAATDIDRGLHTNGRRLTLITGHSEGNIDRVRCQLSDLPAHADALEAISRDGLTAHLENLSVQRQVVRRLACNRQGLATELATTIGAVGGRAYQPQFEAAAEAFLEDLIVALERSGSESGSDSDSDSDSDSGSDLDSDTGSESDLDSRVSETGTASSDDGEAPSEAETGSETESDTATESDTNAGEIESQTDPDQPATPATQAAETPTEESGEFIVRFFADQGSVGAIGHSTPTGAMVEVAEYLFERGLSGIRVPWPDAEAEAGADGNGAEAPPQETIFNTEPVLADGSPMEVAQQLSNGYYLNTAGTTATCASRVEAMVARTGFRAMLSGDWGED